MIFCKKEILIYFSFLFINYLFAQTNSSVSQIDTTWWYDNYTKGIEYLENNELEAAETEFGKILETDESVARAYYGLGQVYEKREKDSDEAVKNLQKAIELDPDLIDAIYHLGIIYENKGSGSKSEDYFKKVIEKSPHYIKGWTALARVEEKFKAFWAMPIESKPAEILADGLKYNPEDKILYINFKNYIFWYSYEEIGIPIFKYLIQKNPLNSEYVFDLAQALYNLDQYDSSLNLLDSIEISYSDHSPCRISLLRAKNQFNNQEENEGLATYWRALHALKDSLDAKDFFSDVCYIMTDSEYVVYKLTPIADLSDFYIRFWTSRDPDLETKDNERISEHYKRLKYARKNYRRYVTGYYKNVTLYKFDHPLFRVMSLKFGDELSKPFISKASPRKEDLDDRGLIYVRHGEPDNFAFYNCMECPQNLSWRYYANSFRPELIFHFSKYSEVRGWFLESLPYTFANRGDLGGLYSHLDPSLSLNRDLSDQLWKLDELNNKSIEDVEIGLKTETSDYVHKNTLIAFPFDYLCFKDKNSKTRVDMFYGLEGSHIQLETSLPGNQLNFSTFIGIFDEKWNEVLRLAHENEVPLQLTQEAWESSSIVDTDNFSVQPGDYHFEFQLHDEVSDNLGIYKGTLYIPDYGKNELMLSDIILSGPVSRNTERAIFKKGDIVLNPHMFSPYNERDTIGLYFEIYNLLYDYTDRTNFEVSWILNEAGADETEEEAFKTTLPYSGNTRDDKIYYNLELSDIDSGDYELIIQVKDMESEAVVSKKVELTIE